MPSFLLMRSKTPFSEIISTGKGQQQNTQPEIQNEILDIAASQILNAVVADCKKGKMLHVYR